MTHTLDTVANRRLIAKGDWQLMTHMELESDSGRLIVLTVGFFRGKRVCLGILIADDGSTTVEEISEPCTRCHETGRFTTYQGDRERGHFCSCEAGQIMRESAEADNG